MSGFRARLPWFVGAWLLCQAAGLTAAPLALCCDIQLEASADDACCQGLAPGQTCPLHGHTAPAASTSGTSDSKAPADCTMRSACGPTDLALLSIASGVAVLPTVNAVAVLTISTPVASIDALASSRVELPESPPPRV